MFHEFVAASPCIVLRPEQRLDILSLRDGRANREHRAILGAVREREEQHAISLLSSHILGAGRGLVEFLRKQRSAPSAEGAATPG